MDDPRIQEYFHRRQHSDWSVVDDHWLLERSGDESLGYCIEWATTIGPDNKRLVRYRVHGGVLLVACCERAAECAEMNVKTLDQADIEQELVGFFQIGPERAHIPQLVAALSVIKH